MKIEITNDEQKLVISTEELNNLNYVDLELYNINDINTDNPRGFVCDITVPIDELKAGVDAFMQLKLEEDRRNDLYDTN